jgi:hypothetical protein
VTDRKPTTHPDGLPYCSNTCPKFNVYSGKCSELDAIPDTVCVPALRDMALALDAHDDTSTPAFDEIAKLCGCPEWEYPGQIVRDVEGVVKERDKLRKANAEHDVQLQAMRACIVYARDRRSGSFDFDTWIKMVEYALRVGDVPPHALEDAQSEATALMKVLIDVRTERNALKALAEHEHAPQCAVLKDPLKASKGYACDCGFNIAAAMRAAKDAAYNERDRCVAALAWLAFRLGWTVGVGQHDPADTKWDADWRTIIYIEFPTGQASWHIHDSEVKLVRGLPSYTKPWDGHTTPEKYSRLEALLDEPPSAVGPDVWAVAAFRAASEEADKLREHLRIARIVRDDSRYYGNLYLEEKRAAIAQQNKLRADVVQLIGERDKLQEERDKIQVTATALLRQLGDIATTMHDLGLGVEADVGVKTTSQAACDLIRSLSKEVGANTTVSVGPITPATEQCQWVFPDEDQDEGYWNCQLEFNHEDRHEAQGGLGRGLRDQWYLPCKEAAHTFVGDCCRDCGLPVVAWSGAAEADFLDGGKCSCSSKYRELAPGIHAKYCPLAGQPLTATATNKETPRTVSAAYPPSCRTCKGTGVIETGNNDLPCDCAAGDHAMFNTGGMTLTGAQIKARR